MKVVVISHTGFFDEEASLLTKLFEAGLGYCHIRKPDADLASVERLIGSIPQQYHRHLIIHYHLNLIDRFNLKGVHFSHNNKQTVSNWSDIDCHKSVSVHSPGEVKEYMKYNLNYQMISPVFDSISKAGYRSHFDMGEVKAFIKLNQVPLIALGGVDETKIDILREAGFEGVALHGALWGLFDRHHDMNEVVDYFVTIKKLCSIVHTS